MVPHINITHYYMYVHGFKGASRESRCDLFPGSKEWFPARVREPDTGP